MESLAPSYPQVTVRTYTAGKDVDYLPKYGMVTKSMLIINETKVISDISKSTIRKAFETAVQDA